MLGGTGLDRLFSSEIKKQRLASMHGFTQWRWHLDEVFVRINGETYYLWRATDHEGEVLEVFVTKKRDKLLVNIAFFAPALLNDGRDRVRKRFTLGICKHTAFCTKWQVNIGIR